MQLLESGKADGLFPSDVVERAKKYLAAIPGGTGAYSDSRGAMVLRKDIAKVIHHQVHKMKKSPKCQCIMHHLQYHAGSVSVQQELACYRSKLKRS